MTTPENPATVPPAPAPANPPRKRALGTILGIVGTVLVLVVVVAIKFGLGSWLLDDGPDTPRSVYDQTLAEDFPNGAAGLVMPAATAVPGFTADEVAAALQTVRNAMVAGRLDDTMLYRHDRSALARHFSVYGQEFLDELFDENLGGVVATMIAPGHRLTSDPIKVKGETTFSGDVLDDVPVLVVHTNYVWVYPFPGELTVPGDHLVTIHDRVDWIFPVADEVDPDFVGMHLGPDSEYAASNIDCALFEQDLIALGELVETDAEVGSPDDVFDPDGSLEVPAELSC